MKKGLVIILAVVVAAVLVAAVIWTRDDGEDGAASTNEASETQQNTTEGAEQLTVKYNGASFVPSTLTVKQGDTVTFVNESSTLVQPASDDHPVHDDLSGFDALEGLAKGEEYSFTFDEVGEWGYHNHLNSAEGGTIIVE